MKKMAMLIMLVAMPAGAATYDFTGKITDSGWDRAKVGDEVFWTLDFNDQNPTPDDDPQNPNPNSKNFLALSNVSLKAGGRDFKASGPWDWKVSDGVVNNDGTVQGPEQGTAMDIPVGGELAGDGDVGGNGNPTSSGDFDIILNGGSHGADLANTRDLDKQQFSVKQWYLSVIDTLYEISGEVVSIFKRPDAPADNGGNCSDSSGLFSRI